MTADETPAAPIACTLGTGAYEERLARIAELNRSALKSVRREGGRLILLYDARFATRVREMVRREQQCCAFLRFEWDEGKSGLTLLITAPESARDVLDALFDPFTSGSPSREGLCACTAAEK